jgi:hypothetical protein
MTVKKFATRVSTDCKGLPAIIARKALEENKLDELMEIYREHFDRNPDILNKMLGDELFSLFIKIK